MKLPKYVRIRNQTLFYQRDYPLWFQRRYGLKTYSRSLKLKASQCSESELQKTIANAAEMYELNVKMFSNSDPAMLTDTELDKAAAEWIEKKGYRHGEFADDEDWQDIAFQLEPELDEANDAWKTEEVHFRGEEPVYTTRQEVMRRAYKALTSHTARKPVLISDAWTS
jgi:metal-dependent amidase/aminoacylase/carboxypeptidase family protein